MLKKDLRTGSLTEMNYCDSKTHVDGYEILQREGDFVYMPVEGAVGVPSITYIVSRQWPTAIDGSLVSPMHWDEDPTVWEMVMDLLEEVVREDNRFSFMPGKFSCCAGETFFQPTYFGSAEVLLCRERGFCPSMGFWCNSLRGDREGVEFVYGFSYQYSDRGDYYISVDLKCFTSDQLEQLERIIA